MGSEVSGATGGTDRGGSDRGSDPIGDFQRWLMRAGARSVGRDVADRVKTTLNGGRRTTGEVWEIATTEPPPDEAPECAWCPICRAARRYRESAGGGGSAASGPAASTPPAGRGSQFAGVSETLAGLAQDAFSIFDSALRSAQRPSSRPADSRPAGQARPPWASATTDAGTAASDTATASPDTGTGWPATPSEQGAPAEAASSGPVLDGAPVVDDALVEPSPLVADTASSSGTASDHGPVVGSPVLGGTAVHPQDQDGESAHEGGDREEGGEAGDGPADDGRDDQVERPAE